MKYTIVVTAHNVADFVQHALNSVKVLDGAKYEVLIFNDGSTDNTKNKISQSITSMGNAQIIDCAFGYPGAVRNAGISHATGDYIYFLDGDDAFEPSLFQKIDNLIDGHRNSLPDLIMFDWILGGNMTLETGEMVCQNDKHSISSAVWNKVYRTDFLREQNILFPGDIVYEDMEFTIDCLTKAEKLLFLGEVGYFYRVRSSSITNTKMTLEQKREALVAVKNVIKYNPTDVLRKEYFAKYWWYHMEKLLLDGKQSFSIQRQFLDLLDEYQIIPSKYVKMATRFSNMKFRVTEWLLIRRNYSLANAVFNKSNLIVDYLKRQ